MTDRRRAGALAATIVLVVGLFAGTVAVRGGLGSVQAEPLDTACAEGDGGARYATDAGLTVFEDDPNVTAGSFPDDRTVDFGHVALSGANGTRARLAVGTGSRTCLGDVATTGSALRVDPADGPTVTLSSNVSGLVYRDSVTIAESRADLAYDSTGRANLTFLSTGYDPGTVVEAVDAETGVALAEGTVQADGSLPFSLSAGSHSVDLQLAEGAVSVTLNKTIYSEERGDVARIGVGLSNTDTATVTIGSVGDNNYASNVTVRDGNGDDFVTVEFNTYTAGAGDDTYGDNESYVVYSVADPADEVVRVGGKSGSFDPASADEATLAAADYSISAVAGERPAERTRDGADAVATLSLGERSTDGVSTYLAPGARLGDFESAADIRAALENGNLTETSEVATGDLYVAKIDASGLSGVLKNGTDAAQPNATAAFFAEARSHGAPPASAPWGLYVNQTNPGANTSAYSATLNAGNSRLVPDHPNNDYWLVVDTGAVPEFTEGDDLETDFTTRDEDDLNPDDTTVLDTWRFADAAATVDTNADTDGDGEVDEVTVAKAAGQRITGTSNVAPGTTLRVRVTGTDRGSPFVKPLTARVQPDGSWAATADFGDNARGANFSVDVRRGSERLTERVDGRITAAPVASVIMNDQESFGAGVTVSSVTMSDGGFVALHLNNASGEVVGHSGYIEAGSESDIEISLDESLGEDTTLVAMPHTDSDGDRVYEFEFGSSVDAPYTENGSAVVDGARITVTPLPTTSDGDSGGDGGDGDGGDGGPVTTGVMATGTDALATTDTDMATGTDATTDMAMDTGTGTDAEMDTGTGTDAATDTDAETDAATTDATTDAADARTDATAVVAGGGGDGGDATTGADGGGGTTATTKSGPGFGLLAPLVVILAFAVGVRRTE